MLYGIGVGPGDPELVTRKAWRLIGGLPVLAYPASAPGESFARSIVAEAIPADIETIEIVIPIRPQEVTVEESYGRAAETIAARLDSGRDVGVLCLGDPLFYGSFIYLMDRLADRFPCEIVPGVTSFSAGAAASGRPLTLRNDVFAVIPATLAEDVLADRLGQADSAAILKVGRHLAKVRRVIARLGLSDNATYVANATLAGEVVAPLAAAPQTAAPYFSMVLVRKESGS